MLSVQCIYTNMNICMMCGQRLGYSCSRALRSIARYSPVKPVPSRTLLQSISVSPAFVCTVPNYSVAHDLRHISRIAAAAQSSLAGPHRNSYSWWVTGTAGAVRGQGAAEDSSVVVAPSYPAAPPRQAQEGQQGPVARANASAHHAHAHGEVTRHGACAIARGTCGW